MTAIQINNVRLHYTDEGSGPETVVFAHGLLWSGEMFREQVAALKDRYRCITFDFRGQGQSEVTLDGYDIETLYGDTIALIETLNAAPCHFVGASMGGFIGMRLAIRRPELLKSLTLMATTASAEPPKSRFRYNLLAFLVRWFGQKVVVDRVMHILFGPTFMGDPARAELRSEWKQRLISGDRMGLYRATKGAVPRASVHEALDRIKTATLIVVGAEDDATTPAQAEQMRARIPGATLAEIPRAGHTPTIEEPEAVTAALEAFLSSL